MRTPRFEHGRSPSRTESRLRALLMMMLVALLAGCRGGSSVMEVGARTEVQTTTQRLTAGSVLSINGTYGAGCIDRSGAWSALVSGTDPLTHPALSVVKNNTACTLTLTSIVADQTYTGTPSFTLTTEYQASASSFQSGASLDFYANARLSSVSFADDFVLTVLVSADADSASMTSTVPTALKWFGSGIGDFADTNETEPIGVVTTWNGAASGSGHACGTRVDGTLWCWGSNDYGQLGIGSASATPEDNPVQVGVATTWKAIAAGTFHSCASRTNGTLWCWGYNNSGQLGLGNTTQQTSPTQVGVATTWNSVATGDSHTCAIRTDGTLWCWGYNAFGQIGNGNTTTPQTGPVQVGTSTKWSSVSAGSIHTCATRTDGTLWCWGDNGFGAVGIGSTAGPQLNPVQVGSVTTWRAVSAGQNHACATRTDGTLWCWGDNTHGKIGIGSLVTPQTSPVQVGIGTSWSMVAAGNEHTCATRTDWTLWCWGLNASGQLGLGNFTSPESSPTQTTESDLVRGVFSSPMADANLVTTATQSGLCGGSPCSSPACNDALQNGGESDVDCGGSSGCARCDTGEVCWAARDCLSVVCGSGACQAPTCSDAFHNGDETDVDCGGSCLPCADNSACDINADCESGVCTGNLCQVPTCSDTVQNGDETDVDCGGSCSPCACPAGWAYSRTLLLNTTAGGANVSGTVQNFPVLVRLNPDNFDFTQAKADGGDIRFFDADSNSLPYEVEDWDATGTNTAIWALVPEVLGNSDQQFISLCWGNPSAASESAGNTVFSTSNGFRGVWHLNATNELQDSTGNQAGTAGGTPTNAAGTVAGGVDYDNNTTDEVAVAYHSSQNILGGDYTVSAWVEPDEDWNSLSDRRAIVSNQCGSYGYSLWADPDDQIHWETRADGGWRNAGGNAQAWIADTKYHIAVSQDETANTLRFFVNGVETKNMSYNYTTYANSTSSLKLGHYQCNLGNGVTLDGTLDEVRISNSRRSNDWIKLAYENQKTDQTLVEHVPDCGGGTCADGEFCSQAGDCASGVCTGNFCEGSTCSDAAQNGDETDTDCGGSCSACADGESCVVNADCQSNTCTGSVCQSTCSDAVQNGDETDTDCGGSCSACADGESCVVNADCQSGTCTTGVCQAGTLRDPDDPANTVAGLHYRYYENDGAGLTQLPNFSTIGPKTQEFATVFDTSKAERADNFELVFDGYIDVPTNGVYTFYTTSDDGSKLSIGGTVVVDNDLIHTSQEQSGTIGLKAGKHAIQVAYFDATSSNVLEARYEGPGISKQVIPAGVLYRTACVDSTKVYCDGFDDNSIADWTQVYQNSPAGTWNLTTETGPLGWSTWVLRQTVYSDSNYKYLYPSGASYGPWGNQTIMAWVKPVTYGGTSNKGGVCVRFNPGTDNASTTGYCLLLINEASPALEIVKKNSGGSTPARLLKSTTGLEGTIPAFPTGTWNKVKFVATGTSTVTLTGYINDVRLIETTDSTSPIATGYPAMVTRGVAFNFDEVTLSSP